MDEDLTDGIQKHDSFLSRDLEDASNTLEDGALLNGVLLRDVNAVFS